MFDRSVDDIFNSLLARVPPNMDKRPSSLIYSVLMALAVELKQSEFTAEYILKNAFADTADRDHLIEIAKEMSLLPMAATSTIVAAIFNADVPIATRFKTGNYFFWVRKVLGKKEDGYYHAELYCETPGALPEDPYLGRIIPVDATGQAISLEGLTKAEIIRTIESGEDEEETEAFRSRYFEFTKLEHYGGNIADYKLMLEAVPGVGGKKIIPVWNGGGTVKAIITDSTHKPPSAEFIKKVKEIIDPVANEGQGYGKAPIDHKVTIEGARAVSIAVRLNLTYEAGQSWATVQSAVKQAIEKYLSEQRAKWEDSDGLVVRMAYIDSRLLDVPGIKDIQNTQINGAARNVTLGQYEVPVLGEVTAT